MLKANSLLKTAGDQLLDAKYTRWTLTELAGHLNDGLREITVQKPTATAQNIVVSLQRGTLQKLPDNYQQFLRAVRNVTVGDDDLRIGGPIITTAQRAILDAQNPYWHDEHAVPARQFVRHFIFDETDPMTFYVYPPNDGTGTIEAVVSKIPDKVEATGNPEELASYDVVVDIKETYANALLDYVLYRAHAKDSQNAGNAQRAALHYQQFANSLGIRMTNEINLSPNVKSNGGTSQ